MATNKKRDPVCETAEKIPLPATDEIPIGPETLGKAETGGEGDYEKIQKRRSLYRVLANNIVRELLESGYHGDELLGFASEVLQAINENGWDHKAKTDMAVVDEEEAGHINEVGNIAGDNGTNRRRRHRRSWLTTDTQGRPTLLGRKVYLRMPEPGDVFPLRKWWEDPRVQASLIPVVVKHVLERLEAGVLDEPPIPGTAIDRVDLMICDQPTETAVGLVSLHDVEWTVRQAALGKMIGEADFRGQGMGREATQLILRYGFETLELNRIYLRTLGGNLKNIRLNERMGFRFEGVLQQAAFSGGRRTDVVMMAMLRSEFENH